MIALLEGQLAYIEDGSVVILCSGVGYRVAVSSYVLGRVAGQDSVRLHIHTYVREDILALYGFLSNDELRRFELLISVSGVGPKAALAILSLADPVAIKTAVINRDVSILTKVSGVGKKTAERIVLDLGNKVGKIAEGVRTEAMAGGEAIDALVALGYSTAEARDVLQAIPADIKEIGARVKWALQHMGRKH